MTAYQISKKDGKKLMEKLVTRFKNNMHHYKTPEYNETRYKDRIFFYLHIQDLFMCLGWDVDNEILGSKIVIKDVVKESTVHIEVFLSSKKCRLCF